MLLNARYNFMMPIFFLSIRHAFRYGAPARWPDGRCCHACMCNGGKSGLHGKGCWLMTRGGDATESATENIPPAYVSDIICR